MQHFKAATSVISNLQEIATICQNDSGSTISSHILMVSEGLMLKYLSEETSVVITVLEHM